MNDQVTPKETAELLRLAKECLSYTGDFVELGCYRGDTSVLLGKLLQDRKRLWIYDSFAGLPAKTAPDLSGAGQQFQAGELAVTKQAVLDKIRRAGLHNIVVKKAWFDQLTAQDLPEQVAFAFLDGDLYESIRVSLKLVRPLLAEHGVIVVHDYNNPELPGATRAVEEFLRAHPEAHCQQRFSLAILRFDKLC